MPFIATDRATASPPPHSPSKTGVNALLLGEGQGGGIKGDRREATLSPPLSRKREREQTDVAVALWPKDWV